MKKLTYLFLALIIVACSSDDDNSPQIPQNFYEAHNGVWITTFSDNSQTLIDFDDNGVVGSYYRFTNSGCWSIPPAIGGQTIITSNTPEELVFNVINVPAENVFSGEDLQILIDNEYYTLSIGVAYLNTSPELISFAQIFYAGDFEVELLTISGNFGLQNNNYTYNLCLVNSEDENKMFNRRYKINNKSRTILNKQTQ